MKVKKKGAFGKCKLLHSVSHLSIALFNDGLHQETRRLDNGKGRMIEQLKETATRLGHQIKQCVKVTTVSGFAVGCT